MNTIFDFSPLWRSGIGFDHLFDMLGQVAETDHSDSYPPYDIEKTGEDVYRLTLALAGWTPDEIGLSDDWEALREYVPDITGVEVGLFHAPIPGNPADGRPHGLQEQFAGYRVPALLGQVLLGQ